MADRSPPLDALGAALHQAAPPGSHVELIVMPSGAFDVTVRRADGPIVVMQGYPHRRAFGLTPDMRGEDAGFDDGHPIVMHDYDEAIRRLLEAVGGHGE